MITVIPRAEAGQVFFEAKDSEETLGTLIMSVSDKECRVNELNARGIMTDLLIRSALAYAQSRGYKEVSFDINGVLGISCGASGKPCVD